MHLTFNVFFFTLCHLNCFSILGLAVGLTLWPWVY